jgi:hypothetical protein
MSLQADLDNIKTKTGKTPADFYKLAEEKGFFYALNAQKRKRSRTRCQSSRP